MNGTNFFLAVNFIIALSFFVVFVVVSTRSRSRIAARWIAAGFAVAAFSTLFELMVAHTDLVKVSAVGAFASVLGGLQLLRVGIARLYGDRISLSGQVLFFAVWCGIDLMIYDLPRGTVAHAFTYQAPFAWLALSGAGSVFRSSRKLPVDWALAALLLLTAVHFVGKAALAVVVGAGETARDYVTTNYAIISQSATGVMVVTAGLMLLAVLVLEIMAEERSNSEQDALSKLLNRRGFENHVATLLRGAPTSPHSVIMCDLDHFKNINDTYGHHCGDAVIEALGELLRSRVPPSAVVGRLGGEEFAVFLPNIQLAAAVPLAEVLRASMASLSIPGLPAGFRATASFGVAALAKDQSLPDAMRDADRALYRAKADGRNCVRRAGPAPPALSIVSGEVR
ncbi:GGDEF domain-containing protein [Pseudorhizobium endolithicum]|uniref:diguanylate cyclase n=1 Tax=Pseudorhizobium endolithicum TaxID=1191678 RepID=A0ABN7JUU2_9HYPH|nr:GGDEF domain-containing protein [Pseudorhizobium endolithicum]CAD7044928.1 GGDEF domain-containing protein [Pseudorhizobium endolithicum]